MLISKEVEVRLQWQMDFDSLEAFIVIEFIIIFERFYEQGRLNFVVD